jgi:hypothetical protein
MLSAGLRRGSGYPQDRIGIPDTTTLEPASVMPALVNVSTNAQYIGAAYTVGPIMMSRIARSSLIP